MLQFGPFIAATEFSVGAGGFCLAFTGALAQDRHCRADDVIFVRHA